MEGLSQRLFERFLHGLHEFRLQIDSRQVERRACMRALVGLKVRALGVDLPAVGKETAMNPLFVLARRAVWRIAGRRCSRR